VKEPACAVLAVEALSVQPSPLGEKPLRAAKETVDAELRGAGVAAKKSAEFVSVSTRPAPFLRAAVVLEGAGAPDVMPDPEGASKQAPVPNPTLSTNVARLAQLVELATAAVVRITLPFVALKSGAPVQTASGVGSATPFVEPPAQRTRK
jgi:hypothetical protein